MVEMTSIVSKLNLKGRVAVVTGATGGLGLYISRTLAEQGASLILIDLDESLLIKTKKNIEDQYFCDVSIKNCDLEIDSQRTALIHSLQKCNIDILINNAAFVGTTNISGWSGPLEEQTIDTWRRAVEVNLTSVFALCKGFSNQLIASTFGGCIINISSIYGLIGPNWSLYDGLDMGNPAAYAASKGGVIQINFVADFLKKPSAEVAISIKTIRMQVQKADATPEDKNKLNAELRQIKYKYPADVPTVKDVVNHIDHVVKLVGIDHVGIGMDMDGGSDVIGVEDVSKIKNVTFELLRRGYTSKNIKKIWGGNTMRVLANAEKFSKK
jgi:NAD(P)-dependent dehydrogenase (short-subunit alcohol dehydrogenase family)